MIGLLVVFLIGTLLYFIWDTARADNASERQLRTNIERGANLYAINCRSCHGMTGKGVVERGGLPGLPLNDPSKRPESAGELTTLQRRYIDTIRCGRVGTLMPQWAQEQGGPLNEFQIQQLVALITGGMPVDGENDPALSEEGWLHAIEQANHQDMFTPAKSLAAAVSATDTTLKLNDVSGLKADMLLRIDDDPTDEVYELVTVTAVAADTSEITVERGAEGSAEAEHQVDAEVFNGPILAPTGPKTGEGGTAPCGQIFSQPAGGASPSPSGPAPVSGTIDLTMGDNFFEYQGQRNPTLAIAAGETLTINITNSGAAIHNLRDAGEDNSYQTGDDDVSDPDIVPGGGTATINITLDQPGTYDYRCDFHADVMKGQIVVQ